MISNRQQDKSKRQKEIRDENSELKTFGYKKLFAWQKSDELARDIYEVTAGFPQSELFGITSQLRRAALSVPANIIEGYARVSRNEFKRFLSITLGSLSEVEYFLDFSYKQRMLSEDAHSLLIQKKEECGRLLWGLYISQKMQ